MFARFCNGILVYKGSPSFSVQIWRRSKCLPAQNERKYDPWDGQERERANRTSEEITIQRYLYISEQHLTVVAIERHMVVVELENHDYDTDET